MGLNNLFDAFDCQVHQFEQQKDGLLYGDINWRVQLSDGDFIERHTAQKFKQVGEQSTAL
jgi:violaxanthin de-epoxidase